MQSIPSDLHPLIPYSGPACPYRVSLDREANGTRLSLIVLTWPDLDWIEIPIDPLALRNRNDRNAMLEFIERAIVGNRQQQVVIDEHGSMLFCSGFGLIGMVAGSAVLWKDVPLCEELIEALLRA
jgi:hypothetical protein